MLAGIEAARQAGFERIRLNTVAMKGRNADEVLDLVGFAVERGLDISFIQEMPLGEVGVPPRPPLQRRGAGADRAPLRPLTRPAERRAARYVRLRDHGQTLIGRPPPPHSHNFCATCNRVRLTAEAPASLGHENSLDRGPPRRDPTEDGPVLEAIGKALLRKPQRRRVCPARGGAGAGAS